MGFIDEIKRLARPYEDEEDEEEYDDFDAPAPRSERKEKVRDVRESTGSLYNAEAETRRSNKVVNIHTTTQLQVVLVKPDRFENAAVGLKQESLFSRRHLSHSLSKPDGTAAPRIGAERADNVGSVIGYRKDAITAFYFYRRTVFFEKLRRI